MLYPLILGFTLFAASAQAQNNCSSNSIYEFYQSFKNQNPLLNQIQKRMEQAEAEIDVVVKVKMKFKRFFID